MLPFCGYHMGDYFSHWLKVGENADPQRLPKIYYVNWFRRDATGKFLWPGYGENSRVLKWICERVEGAAKAMETPIGRVPAPGALDISGLLMAPSALDELLRVDVDDWMAEVPLIKAHFEKFGDKLPDELLQELTRLERRLLRLKK